jgi:ribose transport system ATP-binding protein
MAMGMAMVPEDRQREGLVLPASVEDNLTLPSLIELSGWMGMHRKPRHEASRSLIEQMGIKTASRASSAQSLSGGNQQKIVLGKWVYRQPRLFILDEPTRGVDVGAKEEVHRMIEQLAAGGSAILLISSDMPEILRLSDRILTLCQGRIKGEIASHEATQEILLQWALPEERDALS